MAPYEPENKLSDKPSDEPNDKVDLIPGFTRTVYHARGPHTLRFGHRQGVTTPEDLAMIWERRGDDGPRTWLIEFAIGRHELLGLANAGVIALTPQAILAYTITEPVLLRFRPSPALSRALDDIEDTEPLLSPVTKLIDPRVHLQLLDADNLAFVQARQASAPGPAGPTTVTGTP